MWGLPSVNDLELPPGPCFIYGNHSNNYDPFILNAFTRLGTATAGVMTMEYLESGPIASLFTAVGIQGTRKRVPEPHLIRRIYRMLDEGRRVVIFPEGGRRWEGRPAPWIESTAKFFMRAGAPVYPVEIIGSYVAWPRWAPWPRPANIKVKVHDAVDFSDRPDLETGLARLKAPIAADETIVDPDIRPSRAFRPAVGLDRLLYRDPASGEFNGLQITSGSRIQGQSSQTAWRVLPDSRLESTQDGSILSSADVYATVRSLPILPDSAGCIVSNAAEVTISDVDGNAKSGHRGSRIALYSDRIEVADLVLPLESVLYMGLERSDRIWLMSSETRVKAYLPEGSVLAYYDTLNRIAPHINN